MPKTLRLILGDQLYDRHSWFNAVDPHVTYTLMEVRQETDYVTHHIQKVAAFFKAMRSFAEHLKAMGHQVVYLQLDDPHNRQSIEKNVKYLIQREKFQRLEYQHPDEYRLQQDFLRWSKKSPIEVNPFESEHFLSDPAEFRALFAGKKRYLMETFYRHMRKRCGILMEKGKPEGGKWNYDAQNRNRYDGKLALPEPLLFDNAVDDILEMIQTSGVKTLGNMGAGNLIWPVDSTQAHQLLEAFVAHGLTGFGTYQDAMTADSWALFHSRLSFALNVKLLHPLTVIERVVSAYREAEGAISIAQVEGFVRQILGWREYIRCMYWELMPDFQAMNFFGHRAKLPEFYWTADTRMACLKQAIGQSLDFAYAHHIQRLMLTGSFALLAGVAPAEVEAWYLGIYIDAVQWVELPNTLGMSQFADGGKLATKPYVSSARYIQRMSDYCSACHYRHNRSFGERACPFNSLYWDFVIRHQERLKNNVRMGMVYRTWERMKSERRHSILSQAAAYQERIDDL
ncbi:MAG: cryptochrome/photolyase family protein [Desulfobacterales bacterium]